MVEISEEAPAAAPPTEEEEVGKEIQEMEDTKSAKHKKMREQWIRGLDHVLPIDTGYGKFKGPIEKLKEMLDSKEVDANQQDVMALRPLHKAAARGYTEACAMLLDFGAEIDALDNAGMSALMKAEDEKYGGPYEETVALLKARGAKTIKRERQKRFRYNPGGHSYWTWAEDEEGNKYEYSKYDEDLKGTFVHPNWEACTEEIEPPAYLGVTKAELDKKNAEYREWQEQYKRECEEKRAKEKAEKEAAEKAQNDQQQALVALLAQVMQQGKA